MHSLGWVDSYSEDSYRQEKGGSRPMRYALMMPQLGIEPIGAMHFNLGAPFTNEFEDIEYCGLNLLLASSLTTIQCKTCGFLCVYIMSS
ncbi:unnamed protein product [Phytomonas sp. EM1]|nr:unnamed protein product [Phytomonas sp. EM1]|eukprot:CCW62081.1 unnamed protein product [Phytomonas sp. isolate EM1]